jgi:hypothetical protein
VADVALKTDDELQLRLEDTSLMKLSLAMTLACMPLAVAAAQAPYDYGSNCRHWPAARGEFPVGTGEFEVTDSIRSSQYAPAPTPTRRLYVRAWYPAAERTDSRPRPYFTEPESTVLPAVVLKLLERPLDAFRGCAGLATNGHLGAGPAPGRFPIVAFNHGFVAYAAQNTALFEHLAANGYVVLTIGHPYETGGIVYPDGDSVSMSPRLLEDLKAQWILLGRGGLGESIPDRLQAAAEYVRASRHSSFGQLPAVWREDTYFVLDRLEALAVPADVRALAGAIDHQRRGYVGMSFGGYIAALLAQGDPRARAAVNLDGGSWTYELIDADVRTPFMMVNSDPTLAYKRIVAAGVPLPPGLYRGPLGPRTPTVGDIAYERVASAGARPDIHRITVPGVLHESWTDNPAIVGDTAMRQRLGDETALGSVIEIQGDLVLGFLDRYVKGERNGFPRSVIRRHPRLIVRDRFDIRPPASRKRH